MIAMPKISVLNKNLLIETLTASRNDILDCDENILTPSNAIWRLLATKLLCSPKYLYTIVKLNRYNLWTVLNIQYLLKNEHTVISVSENETETSMDYTTDSDSFTEDREDQLNFKIHLSAEEWSIIRPLEKKYKSSEKYKRYKLYTVLPPHIWPEVIHSKFWELCKLRCNIVFKRAKIYKNTSPYCVISGICDTCQSKFSGCIKEEPTVNQEVEIYVKYKGDYKNCTCEKKRFMKGVIKDQALTEMCNKDVAPSEYRKHVANKIMKFGDTEPPIIPSLNALRIAKCRSIKSKRLDDNPIVSLSVMKYSATIFNECIKAIGYDPFFVYYWMPYQLQVYNAYCQSAGDCSKICIDATGGVVKKLKRPHHNKSGNIFLYDITVNDTMVSSQYTVCNMLSEKHDSNSIYSWLATWVKDGAIIPKEVICDHSLALLSAVTRAFALEASLNNYLLTCNDVIFHSKSSLPRSLIRCDVAHTIKIISSWDELRGQDHRIRNLYIRSLAQIIISQSIDDIKSLLYDIFIVALSETEGSDIHTHTMTPCEESKNRLKRRISTGTSDMENSLKKHISEGDQVAHNSTETEEIVQFSSISGFNNFAATIAEDCKRKLKEGDHDNLHYLPSIVNTIIKLMKLLPLWSGIMVPFFHCGSNLASSASVESNFNNLKHRIFKQNTLPLRCDDFLKTHIYSIEGSMKLAASKYIISSYHSFNIDVCGLEKDKDMKVKCEISKNRSTNEMSHGSQKLSDCQNDDESNYTENWRGLALPPKKRPRNSYLEPQKEIMHMNFNQIKANRPIGILKNGNVRLRPLKIKGHLYTVSNTCAFDSLVQIFAAILIDSDEYNLLSDNAVNSFLSVAKDVAHSRITVKTYINRLKILKDIWKSDTFPNKVTHISAETTITNLAEHIFRSAPSAKIEVYCSNTHCGFEKRVIHNGVITLNVNFDNENLHNLQKKIDDYCEENEMLCSKANTDGSFCQGKKQYNTILSDRHLIIEILNSDSSKCFDFDVAKDPEIALNDIPKLLRHREIKFHLRGAVSFSSSHKSLNVIGHYIAFCRRLNEMWEEYNDLSSKKYFCPRNRSIPCHLLCYSI